MTGQCLSYWRIIRVACCLPLMFFPLDAAFSIDRSSPSFRFRSIFAIPSLFGSIEWMVQLWRKSFAWKRSISLYSTLTHSCTHTRTCTYTIHMLTHACVYTPILFHSHPFFLSLSLTKRIPLPCCRCWVNTHSPGQLLLNRLRCFS